MLAFQVVGGSKIRLRPNYIDCIPVEYNFFADPSVTLRRDTYGAPVIFQPSPL
jgi:hypothetical protein